MKLEISKTVLPILAVFLSLYSVSCSMSGSLFHELRICLTFFSQLQQSFLYGSCISSSCSIISSSPGKSSFLPKWLINSIRRLFDAYLPLEVIGVSRSRHVSCQPEKEPVDFRTAGNRTNSPVFVVKKKSGK